MQRNSWTDDKSASHTQKGQKMASSTKQPKSCQNIFRSDKTTSCPWIQNMSLKLKPFPMPSLFPIFSTSDPAETIASLADLAMFQTRNSARFPTKGPNLRWTEVNQPQPWWCLGVEPKICIYIDSPQFSAISHLTRLHRLSSMSTFPASIPACTPS